MAIQPINNRSLRLYGDLMHVLEEARMIFGDAGRLVARYSPPPPDPVEGINWTIPTEDQLAASFKGVSDKLVALKDGLKIREKELVSRTWR